MNLDEAKKILTDMINEADNLSSSELDVIPRTRIRVKKGQIENFKFYARIYYQMTKEKAPENDNYIKDVYYELNEEIAKARGEQIMSAANALVETNKEAFARLDALNKSLASVRRDLNKYDRELREIDSTNTTEWEREKNIQKDREEARQNMLYLENVIAELATDINKSVIDALKKEMQLLREECLNTRFGTQVKVLDNLDGATILAKDEEYYYALLTMMNILEKVNGNDPIININNAICVNPNQEEFAKSWFEKIDMLKLASKEEKQEEGKEKPNDALIKKIVEEKNRLDAKIEKEHLDADQIERDNLLEILKYLNAANDKEYALTKVWDIAYVNGPDREAFINLLRETSFFKGYNPDLKMVSENETLIGKLKGRLEEIENNYNHYPGTYNIPLAQVGNTIILREDKQEYENILSIINILENAKENLINVKGCGNVPLKDVAKYEDLISKTKYFTPNLVQDVKSKNQEVLNGVKEDLRELQSKMEEQAKLPIEDAEVVQNIADKFSLLKEQKDIIESTDPSSSLTEVEGALINTDKAEAYRYLIDVLKKIREKEAAKIKESSKAIPLGPAKSEAFTPEKPKIDLNPVPIPRRKAITSVRKTTKKEWWKKNWKKVAGIGLSLAIVTFTLTTLAPTLIYLNSCLAMALPGAAGTLGSINNVLATIGWVTMNSLNFNVAASNLLGALGTSAVKLGLIGGGALASYKILKRTDENRLPDPKEKESALAKIKELGNELIGRTKELTENLAYAVDGPNINQNQYINDQLGKNAEIESLEEEETFQEIDANVQNAIEEEEQIAQQSMDTVNKRFEQIKNDMNEAVTSPVATPEELKEETEEDTLSSDIIDLTPKASPSKAIPLPEQTPITIPSEEELNRLLSEGLEANEESLGRGR